MEIPPLQATEDVPIHDEDARNELSNGSRKWRAYIWTLRQGLYPKPWTFKGCITRLFGQGAQNLFITFPARPDAAVTGSVAVALYDMHLHKKDVTWIPNDLDIFIAVPYEERALPLAKAFPIMNQWLDDAREQGFHYELAPKGSTFGTFLTIFDFICTNPQDHPTVKHPKVSFIIRCAETVREICDQFDLPLCGAILLRGKDSTYRMSITQEMIPMYLHHVTYSRFQSLDIRTLNRMVKYNRRGYAIVQMPPSLATYDRISPHEFPTIEYYRPRTNRPAPSWYIEGMLGRFPTHLEAERFHIDLSQERSYFC